MKPVRIAITGSAGVGKSTLADRLGGRLGLPVIEEGMRTRLSRGLDLHDLSKADFRALVLELFGETMAKADAARRETGGFVADRAPADFVAFWLYYGLAEDEAATQELFERARAATASLDAVVLLPWGGIPLVDDGVRSANRWWQLHYQALLEGLLGGEFGDAPLWRMPMGLTELERREAWVLERVGVQ